MVKFSDHLVMIHLSLGADGFGDRAARDAVRRLEREIEAAVEVSGTGELDGHEFGGGEAVLYLYGADADVLFATVEPVVRRSPLRPTQACLIYGDVRDPATKERTIEL